MQPIARIYIIDDDKLVLHIFDRVVKKLPVFGAIEAFLDSEEAFEKLLKVVDSKTEMPDLVLIDINMPKMNGWEFIEALAKQRPNHGIRFMIISSSVDHDDVARSRTYENVIDFIPKPLSTDKLAYISEKFHAHKMVSLAHN